MGYQGYGSLGRRIIEGQPSVSIHGERVIVRAQVHTLGGFSAHAGQKDLLNWLSVVEPSKPRVIFAHGEDKPRNALAHQVAHRFRLRTTMPRMGEVIEF